MLLTSPLRLRLARQVRLLSAVERDSDVVTRRFTQAFNRRAEYALRRGQMMTLLPSDIESINEAVLDVMMTAYVKRYEIAKKQMGLNLGFGSEVRNLAKKLDVDLGDTRSSFSWVAKRNVSKSVMSVEDRINRILGEVVSKQLPQTTAVRDMRRQLDEAGISYRKPQVVETLVRTHSQIAFSTAQYNADQDDPYDIIWGYRYSTVGDDRVRDEHAAMEGVTLPKNHPMWDSWWPPNGWNCRCQLIPILNDDEQAPKATKHLPDVDPENGFNINIGKSLRAT